MTRQTSLGGKALGTESCQWGCVREEEILRGLLVSNNGAVWVR